MNWVRRHSAEILVTLFTLAAGVAVYAYAHRDEGSLEESKQRGAVIVEALQRHQTEHGDLPESLEVLVPRYLAEVPQPTWGLRRWRYRRFAAEAEPDRTIFQLSVAANQSGYPVLYYDLTAARWVLNN